MTDTPQGRKVNPIKSFITGGFGGICNVLVGHPLDTIKVRLQTMPSPAAGEKPLYKGTFDCAAKTIRKEGFRGLYRGMSAPLTGVAPIFATCFAGYALGKRLQQKENQLKLSYQQIFVAGMFSGLFSTAIMAPGERIKCLLQVQQGSGAERKYTGMVDCAVKLYKEGGIRSVFKGSCATMLRDLPGNGAYYLVYEYLQETAKEKTGSGSVSVWSTIFAGGCAGIAYWVVGMPADVLKSRLQTDIPGNGAFFLTYEILQKEMNVPGRNPNWSILTSLLSGGIAGVAYWTLSTPADVLKSRLQTAPEGTYTHGIRSVFIDIMLKESPMALYRGVFPIILRAFTANAVCFFTIELFNTGLRYVIPEF